MAFPTFNMPTRSLNKTLQFATRCRKRHYNITMNVLNLLLLGCCLSLILNPGYTQAKEESKNNNNNNATLKSENMLHVDDGDDQMQLLNKNKNDKNNVNDNDGDDQGVVTGTFKRLKPLDYKDLEQQLEEDIEKEQKDLMKQQEEEGEEDDDERSSEIIEMIQPAQHTLRHQEHYKQRILMKAKEKNHFKENNNNKNNDHGDRVATIDIDNDDEDDDDDEEDYDLEENEHKTTNQHNRNLRYQQIQLALREPTTTTTTTTTNTPPLVHHHRRHEHHFVKQQKMAKQTEFLWPQQQQQHHLRHQHQHHKHSQSQQSEPQELHHYSRKQNQTTNSKPLLKHQRYFDREISYAQPWIKLHSPTTEGPHLRHSNANNNRYWKSISNPHNRLFNDEQHLTQNDNQKENSKSLANDDNDNGDDVGDVGDIKRITLSLHSHDTDDNKLKDLQGNEQKPFDYNDNDPKNEQINKNQDYNDDLEDDYSYEDDDNDGDDEKDKKEINKSLKYPSIISQEKTNVKRYTKPKTFTSTSYAYRSPTKNTHLRHSATIKTHLNTDTDDDADDYEEDNLNENSDDTSNDSDEDDDKFTDEKWNKIEHEHYRKQLQHQRAMQALRARRPSSANDNTPKININRYASYTPPAAAKSSPSSSFSAAWTKRQTVNEDDGDNIYSRYYVPGSVTRKKEEELGSPAAVLESRRQYALQQRQNKALASAHHRRIVTEGSCRLPQPRVERVRRDSWKIYTPHCTILHRCADDGGCCPSERQTCAPKRTKNVDLYFFVISLNETQGSIEKLTFVNHTECHCVERSKQRAPEYGTSLAKDLLNNNQIPYLRRASILNCNCPNLFEKILQEDGYCRCDCSSGNMGCDWLKRGMEHFSMNDRKCIMEGRCKLPTCEYGQYIKKHGRCPRREERHLTSDVDW